ncbi:hypothetical protein AYJ54_14270 [Bradyrhizobium centrolobii]|uniref:Uncharacterized protein n=1 Tax=Bradyrhizobium centrolobii TaxID=1505087 RepID=A0A176YQS8_9BRAD|nr:hypothetical protein AYJ54_14270 [Bradyrhizobium centrolobii]
MTHLVSLRLRYNDALGPIKADARDCDSGMHVDVPRESPTGLPGATLEYDARDAVLKAETRSAFCRGDRDVFDAVAPIDESIKSQDRSVRQKKPRAVRAATFFDSAFYFGPGKGGAAEAAKIGRRQHTRRDSRQHVSVGRLDHEVDRLRDCLVEVGYQQCRIQVIEVALGSGFCS